MPFGEAPGTRARGIDDHEVPEVGLVVDRPHRPGGDGQIHRWTPDSAARALVPPTPTTSPAVGDITNATAALPPGAAAPGSGAEAVPTTGSSPSARSTSNRNGLVPVTSSTRSKM